MSWLRVAGNFQATEATQWTPQRPGWTEERKHEQWSDASSDMQAKNSGCNVVQTREKMQKTE